MIKSFAVTNDLNERLDLVLNDPWQSGIVVKSVEGLGPGKVTVHMRDVANGDGGFYGGSRTPVRNIVLNLAFTGSPSIEDSRLLTYRYFPVKKQVILTVVTDNNEVSIDGYVESNEPDIFSNLEGCQISILCPNPYFYTERDQLSTSSGIFPMLEFPIDNELIEDPETDKRIPSDEPYIDYGNILVGGENEKFQNDDLKYLPFDFYSYSLSSNGLYYIPELIENATTEIIDGSLPFKVSFLYVGSGYTEIRNRVSGMFYLKIPFSRNMFDNNKKYTLSFLVDGKINSQLLGDNLAFVLDLYVYVNGSLIYSTGKKQQDSNGYARLPVASIYKKYSPNAYLENHSSKNVRINIPLTGKLIDSFWTYGLPYFYAKASYINKNGNSTSLEPMATYGYSMLIHDVSIYENEVETRSGFAGETSYIYKWNPYIITLDKDKNFEWLLFNQVKEKMEWDNNNDGWKPKSEGGYRTFILEFDIDGVLYQKYNGSVSDYLVLEIKYRSDEYVNVYEINEEIEVCHFSSGKSFSSNTIKDYQIEISEDLYYKLLYSTSDRYGSVIHFYANYARRDNNTGIWISEKPDGETKITISNIKFYEVLQPTRDQNLLNKIYYLIDEGMPDYAFTKDGKKYNLRASEGIIMGEIQKYGFEHLIRYEGNANIGFQITISFVHTLALFDQNGLVGNPGFIVITSNYYPRKKMVVDLRKVWEIIQSAGENDGQVIPITEPGDQLFIDTRKNKKTIRYQKPYDYTYKNSKGETVVWDHSGYKINVLAASNRDIEWFELHQGDNILTIQHKSDPDMEREEDLENDHSEYLEVEVRNRIYYEGV